MKNSLITILLTVLISLTFSCGVQKSGSTSPTKPKEDPTTPAATSKQGVYFKSNVYVTSFTINIKSGSLYEFESYNYSDNSDFTRAYPKAFVGCSGTALGISCYKDGTLINVSGKKICDADLLPDNSNLEILCYDAYGAEILDANCIEIK